MAELIDPTWIAWSTPEPPPRSRIDAAIEQIREHYQAASAPELAVRKWAGERGGVAVIGDPAPACRWPAFSADSESGLVAAYAYPVPGWRALTGAGPGDAGLALARELLAEPARAARELDPPLVAAIAEASTERIVIVNDRLGAGRLYEAGFGGGFAYSNRAGALPILAGHEPRASEHGWALFAAAGWFIRDETSIEGVRRVRPGSVIELRHGRPRRIETGAIAELLAGAEPPLGPLVEAFTATATATATGLGELWPLPARVDLSGGRDSRLAAAIVLASGADPELHTSDMTPGEADVARELVASLGRPVEHHVRWSATERKSYEKPLLERGLASHRLHDGMRHAAKLRGKQTLPPPRPEAPVVSGHGGEIAHGFYYTTPAALHKLERGGEQAGVERLVRAARRRHNGGREAVYELARGAYEASFAEGREAGISGPQLLDWFYLMERFAHRSGVAADVRRTTFFAGAGFVRAAFALTPEERIGAELHRAAIATLVPSWSRIPFFAKRKPQRGLRRLIPQRRRLPAERRELIWEGNDATTVERLLRDGGSWTGLYDPDRARELWDEARAGRGDSHSQDVFEGIAYRASFDLHLAELARRARAVAAVS